MTFLTDAPRLITDGTAIVRTLQQHGYIAYFAGGCVRDALLKRSIKDIDIATSATPDEVAKLFPSQSIGVGKQFGVMLVVIQGTTFDIATFRKDGGYQDGRHPTSIDYAGDREDAQRRDFTINGLFYDPITEQIHDYVGGQEDLERRILRAIGEPLLRFQEDRLRMLRAVRFEAVTGFALDPATRIAIEHEASALTCVSVERIASEFIRTLCESAKPSAALERLFTTGLLAVFFPELIPLRTCEQNPVYHPEGNVWNHTTLMLDLIPVPRDPTLVWTALLHDIGKPACFILEGLRTPGHAAVGEGMAQMILRRFKQTNAMIEAVCTAIYYHMQFVELPKMRPANVRRMLGRKTIDLELELHRLDCLGSHEKLDLYELAQSKREAFANEPILPTPLVNGKDLIAIGIKPGKAMGTLLKATYTAQLDGILHTTDEAIAYIRDML